MAKREALGGETGARSEEKPNKAYKQLDHPVRLRGIIAPTTNRKSLYNQQYGVFTRDTEPGRCADCSYVREGALCHGRICAVLRATVASSAGGPIVAIAAHFGGQFP